jgi:hypothetical protein
MDLNTELCTVTISIGNYKVMNNYEVNMSWRIVKAHMQFGAQTAHVATHTTSMIMAVPLLMCSRSKDDTSPPLLSCTAAVGMMMPMQDRNSSELVAWFATALNACVLNLRPPNRKQQPAGQVSTQHQVQSCAYALCICT